MQDTDSEKGDIRRGKAPVLDRDFVCDKLRKSNKLCGSTFPTKAELSKHILTCHCFVICSHCKRQVTFGTYRYSHMKRYDECAPKIPTACTKDGKLPADWTLPDDFLEKFRTSPDSVTPLQKDTEVTSTNDLIIVATSSLQPPIPALDIGMKVPENEVPKSAHVSITRKTANNEDDITVATKDATLLLEPYGKENDDSVGTGYHSEDSGLSSVTYLDTQKSIVSCPQALTSSPSIVSRVHKRPLNYEQCGGGSPPEKRRLRDQPQIMKYAGNCRRKFKGTPNTRDEDVSDTQSIHEDDSTEPCQDEVTDIVQRSDQGSCSSAAVDERNEGIWLDSIKHVMFDETTFDLKLQLEEIVNPIEAEPCIFQNTNSSVIVNSRVLQLWHILDNGIALNVDHLYLPYGVIDGHVLYPVLAYLHSGVGILECEKLIKFMNGNALEVIHATLVGLLLMSSVQEMSSKEFRMVCESVGGVKDPSLRTLLHLCFYWTVSRSTVNKDDKNIPELPTGWPQTFDLYMNSHSHKKDSQIIRTNVTTQITYHLLAMENEQRLKATPRALHFECTIGQVSVLSQDYFFARLLNSFMDDGTSNVLLNVLKLNCDHFNKTFDTSFVINVKYGEKSTVRTFYIQTIVLAARLGIGVSAISECLRRIMDKLIAKTFENKSVELFWQFLHNQERNDEWDVTCNIAQLVELCMTFQIESLPMFLYGHDEPNTSALMRRFVAVFMIADDSVGLTKMCRQMLENIELSSELSTDTLISVLSRDDLLLDELAVYKLVVKVACWGHYVDASKDDVPTEVTKKFIALRKVIRFESMSLKDFDENVYDDPFLDPELIAIFRHNIYCYAKGKPNRCIKLSEEFRKSSQPRC